MKKINMKKVIKIIKTLTLVIIICINCIIVISKEDNDNLVNASEFYLQQGNIEDILNNYK